MTKAEARRAIGALVEDVTTGRTGIVQAAEEWEDPKTRRVAFTVFVRPQGGGIEWLLSPGRVRRVAKP